MPVALEIANVPRFYGRGESDPRGRCAGLLRLRRRFLDREEAGRIEVSALTNKVNINFRQNCDVLTVRVLPGKMRPLPL